MTQVSQKVLNWLYSVLTSEYHDVNRTYSDVYRTLAVAPGLAPRTSVYTFENGQSALLLNLSGTIPVSFRGATYQFPISIWVTHAYPHEAPIVFVTPTGKMLIRPGQHVGVDGRVYHPYLAGWSTYWDKSTMADLLGVLRDIFSKEPPVIARQEGPSPTVQPPAPPPVPPLPPELASTPETPPRQETSTAPPRPPKETGKEKFIVPNPKEIIPQGKEAGGTIVAFRGQGPPMPPLPNKPRPEETHVQHLPPQHHFAGPSIPSPSSHPQNPLGSLHAWHSTHSPALPVQPVQLPTTTSPQAAAVARAPPPDLMSGSIAGSGPTMKSEPVKSKPAPPIPPNPEKDALLARIMEALEGLYANTQNQAIDSLRGLEAQHSALAAAHQRLNGELSALQSLETLLASNESIYRDTFAKADKLITDVPSLPQPPIDDVLVPPTVVGNQLYEVVTEELAIGDAIFVLARALDRERISAEQFSKNVRSLARERFLRRALVNKIAKGMALESGRGRWD